MVIAREKQEGKEQENKEDEKDKKKKKKPRKKLTDGEIYMYQKEWWKLGNLIQAVDPNEIQEATKDRGFSTSYLCPLLKEKKRNEIRYFVPQLGSLATYPSPPLAIDLSHSVQAVEFRFFPVRKSHFLYGGNPLFSIKMPPLEEKITGLIQSLSTQSFFPTGIWIAVSVRAMLGFSRLTVETYSAYVHTTAETVKEAIWKILKETFHPICPDEHALLAVYESLHAEGNYIAFLHKVLNHLNNRSGEHYDLAVQE
ncbi:hypothetical protein Tco_0620936, partial [Tanacetum coccineum]